MSTAYRHTPGATQPRHDLDVGGAIDRSYDLVREAGLEPIYAAVKGSVVYELPGTHRDVDVRMVYLAPTDQVLSIRKPKHTFERMEGTLDLVGWEAERFFGHLLKHNGNMVEMLHTPERFTRSGDRGHVLQLLGKKFITKKLYDYYRGYAQSQFKRAQQQIRTGKGATYTMREMYAGLWLLRTGEIVFPWAELRAKVEGAGIYRSALIDEFDMDRELITESVLSRLRGEFEELNVLLTAAVEASPLPEGYDGYAACNQILLAWRAAWRG